MLLDEKHQLQYKLNKETEISKMQIKELEQNFEQINDDSKLIKDKYEEQIYDLKRQIESMGSQIKSEKEFINVRTKTIDNKVKFNPKLNAIFIQDTTSRTRARER